MKNIGRIILFSFLLTAPCMAVAQSNDSQKNNKSEVKVNKLDVIYEEEEFKGIVIDHRNDRETESHLYQAPYVIGSDEDDDEDDILAGFSLDDDGAISEDEILLEGFDTLAIHLPKFDVNSITDPILIRLRDRAHGQDFTWPTPWTARASSHFGPRRRRFHYGLDLAQPTGEPIYAAFDGVVRISKRNRSYGHLVIIHHSNGLETYYAHMSKRNVNAGDVVHSGDIIGLCGNTGRSYGSHLHFEIRYMGNAINPEDVLDCATHDLVSDVLSLTPASFRKVAKGGRGNGSTIASTSSTGWYRVRSGDTLDKIARRNGTTVRQLCQLNGIRESKVLHPGDRLRVNGKASKSSSGKSGASSKSRGRTHTVREGETLYRIASSYGISVNDLCRLNGINENSIIRPGQKLRVK